MMVIVLQAVGLPTEAVLTILAVDRVLDMLRTMINVWSDSTCTVVVAALDERREARASTDRS
jgi:Na+/H+-dicarboxylate symporter